MKTKPQIIEHYTLSISSESLDLRSVGGKGSNLGQLVRAGFNVPEGFIILTQAYQDFVLENKIVEKIQKIMPETAFHIPENLDIVSLKIRRLFSSGKLSKRQRDEILSSYINLGSIPVAVRSSATTEDLPEASFAGQQDTFLNVINEEMLLKAVQNCWGSLWTDRAISYRARNHLLHSASSMAVVVQKMIPSQASGVMFTANPLTGIRSEIVIDSVYGLGEALVSGLVEPDHFVIDSNKNKIISRSIGSKKVKIEPCIHGGIEIKNNRRNQNQSLPDTQILSLSLLGQEVENYLKSEQDIEWASVNNQIFLLQSRPITTLYPLPHDLPEEPLRAMFSFAAIQGVFTPITKLGIDTLKLVFAMGAGLFGIKVTTETQKVICDAGQRLWVDFTPLIKNSVGRKIIPAVLDQVGPTIQQAVEQIWDDPNLQPGQSGLSWNARSKIIRFAIPMVSNIFRNLISPKHRRKYLVAHSEKILSIMEKRSAQIRGDRYQKLLQRVHLLPDLAIDYLPRTLILFISGVAAGIASWNLLRILTINSLTNLTSEQKAAINDLILNITRGMPYNPTTEMDLALWNIAKGILQDPSVLLLFRRSTPSKLNDLFQSGKLPDPACQSIVNFLSTYGGRGTGEIDLGCSRWVENSTPIFEMLSNYLEINESERAPDKVFAQSADSAQQAVATLVDQIALSHHGWLKARLAGFLAGRVRQLMGLRESPKFFAVKMFWIVRRELLKSGMEFVETGEINHPDDLFNLTFTELKNLANGIKKDWGEVIASRQSAFEHELFRRQIPLLLLSNGRTIYKGIQNKADDSNSLTGSPVSPGSTQGKVRVVLDPHKANLKAGEIIVCPGTDPSWTPLFLTASGLVMETGGMMTHGAVVAREYGIPAIVGVENVTQRLHTGVVIHMDGSTGVILVLKNEKSEEAIC